MLAPKLIEIICRAVPYPYLIRNIEIKNEEVRFDWRGVRYRVSGHLFVEEVRDGILIGSDRAILMKALLRHHDTP